jgi:hypothetical protein
LVLSIVVVAALLASLVLGAVQYLSLVGAAGLAPKAVQPGLSLVSLAVTAAMLIAALLAAVELARTKKGWIRLVGYAALALYLMNAVAVFAGLMYQVLPAAGAFLLPARSAILEIDAVAIPLFLVAVPAAGIFAWATQRRPNESARDAGPRRTSAST